MEKSEIYDKKNNELIIENNSIKWNQTKIDNFIHKIDSHINRVKVNIEEFSFEKNL